MGLMQAKFPAFQPDVTSLMTGVSSLIQNVVPRVDGYGPFQALIELTKFLPDVCRGYFFARRSDGSIAMFAGTSQNLYLLNNIDFSWNNVSKAGGPYAALSSDKDWQFVQFNDTVIVVQANVPPQAYALSSSAAFADLAGSPPQAGSIAVVGFFLVLTEILGNPKRVQWSDLGIIVTWTAGVGFSDFQDLSDGGNSRAVSGGDAYGVIFQDNAVRTLTYSPGSPTVFNILRIGTNETLLAKNSIINIGAVTYYLSASGFKQIVAGGIPQPIGKGRVDDTFKADLDQSNLRLCIGVSDPTQTRVYWFYKSKSGAAGLLDSALIFDPVVGQGGQFSIIRGLALEYVASIAKPGVTLENLDAVAPTPLNVLGAANNGGGKVRLTLDSVDNGKFKIAGQNFIVVQGVGGTTEANGTWLSSQISIVDPTHLDILAANFVHAWTAGGQIGGSLDQLNFSLDSISTSAVAQLSGVDSSHSVGFFTGPNLEAILETSEEGDPNSNMVYVDGMVPFTDCKTAMSSIGLRGSAQDSAVIYTSEVALNSQGWAYVTAESQYIRVRLRLPFGATWTYARAVGVNADTAGEQ